MFNTSVNEMGKYIKLKTLHINSVPKIHAVLREVYEEEIVDCSMVQQWHKKVCEGRSDIKNLPCQGCPATGVNNMNCAILPHWLTKICTSHFVNLYTIATYPMQPCNALFMMSCRKNYWHAGFLITWNTTKKQNKWQPRVNCCSIMRKVIPFGIA